MISASVGAGPGVGDVSTPRAPTGLARAKTVDPLVKDDPPRLEQDLGRALARPRPGGECRGGCRSPPRPRHPAARRGACAARRGRARGRDRQGTRSCGHDARARARARVAGLAAGESLRRREIELEPRSVSSAANDVVPRREGRGLEANTSWISIRVGRSGAPASSRPPERATPSRVVAEEARRPASERGPISTRIAVVLPAPFGPAGRRPRFTTANETRRARLSTLDRRTAW